MIPRLIICLVLAACSTQPQVNWPAGPVGPTPALVPLEGLLAEDASLDTRGAELAAQAAALKAWAAEGG
jgi:hypothetical protein